MQNTKEVASGKIQITTEKVDLAYSKEYLLKNNVGKMDSFSLWTISFGDVGIATLPGELHDSLGVSLREESPFAVTLFSGYTNGTNGYFASAAAFENGGYEVSSSRHEKGASEVMLAKLVSMLLAQFEAK